MASKIFAEIIRKRRSVYGLGGSSPVADEAIAELVSSAILHVPSAFNCQSQRVALLFGARHQQLWTIVKDALRRIVPAAKFKATEEKIDGFAVGHGTVLFFDDTAVTKRLGDEYPTYRANFPIWADHANGMLQFAVWCQLAEVGLGASLQHYGELIDAEVKKAFDLPSSWRLIAQMPFGSITAAPGPKDFLPVAERLRIFS